MSVRLETRKVEVCGAGLTVCVKLHVTNTSAKGWSVEQGHSVGYQIYDPELDILLIEGKRLAVEPRLDPGASREVDVSIEVPPEAGRYRVFVSLVQEGMYWLHERGGEFLVLDVENSGARVNVLRCSVMTQRKLKVELFFRAIARGFKYPAQSIYRNRSLIRSMVKRDLMGRYRGSFGGLYWTVLNPLLLMLTYYFVFGIVLQTRFGNDPSRSGFVLYFLAGMLPWLAFSEAAGRAPFVILEHRSFVKKLVFPVETLPVNIVIAGLVTELLASGIFLIMLFTARGGVPLTVLWLPVLLIPQLLFTVGICWLLSALGVYIRDLGHVNGFLLTLWFFLTPICYPMEQWPAEAGWILSKNPLFVLVRGYRAVFLEGQAPPFQATVKFWALAVIVFLFGHACFYKLRKSFADVI